MPKMTRKRAGELVQELFKILASYPDGVAGSDALQRLRESVELLETEEGEYSPGVPIFEKRMRFTTIAPTKAGWMVKRKGTWYLAEAGRQALDKWPDPFDFMQEAVDLYEEWSRTRPPEERWSRGKAGGSRSSVSSPEPTTFPAELPQVRKRTGAQFQTNPWNLSHLLEMLDLGKIVLPEFQRSFVWRPADIDLLITSLIQDYPAGTLLLLRSNPTNPLAWRAVEEVELKQQDLNPDYLVLDGQQRLTSLSLALNGRGDHLFFIDLARLSRGDVEPAIFPVRRKEAKKAGLLKREVQWQRSLYPVWGLMGADADDYWLEEYVDFHASRGDDRDTVKGRRRFLEDTYLDVLKNYRFPVVELAADTDLEAVCQIFETLNKTGMRLTVFDLLTSKFWPQNLHLRDVLAEAREQYPILDEEEFDVEPTYLLQAISLLRSGACKRGDLLALNREGFETDWKNVCAGASEALSMLRGECGVLTRKWLPYAVMLPALFAVSAEIREMSGPSLADAWEKVKQWFWCSAFGQRYEGPVNSLNATDFRELLAWFEDDGQVPEAVATFAIDQVDLRSVERQRNAVYRAVICMSVVNGARDFYTGKQLTADSLKDPNKRVEDHHIFPKAFVKKLTPRQAPENSVLNRCLIDHQTNTIILDRAPSKYLKEIADRLGVEKLETLLESHLIPTSRKGGLYQDDLEEFLQERERLLIGAVAGVTGAVASAERLGDVYLDPSKPFMNELALRKVLRSLRGRVFWYEQHMSRKALELLAEEIQRETVNTLQLLSGEANASEKAARAFERFQVEMQAAGIKTEWRILPDDAARRLHARVIFDNDENWELPPLNSLLKGTVDSVRRSRIEQQPFLNAWENPSAQSILARHSD